MACKLLCTIQVKDPLNNFVDANFRCLEKQPYRVLHLVASSPPSNLFIYLLLIMYSTKLLCIESADAVDRPLIKPPSKQSDNNQWLLFLKFVAKNT